MGDPVGLWGGVDTLWMETPGPTLGEGKPGEGSLPRNSAGVPGLGGARAVIILGEAGLNPAMLCGLGLRGLTPRCATLAFPP